MHTISFHVNGEPQTVNVPATTTLLELLRDSLHLTGTKEGCGIGECGACTVLLDGAPVTACLTLAVEVDGTSIETIEGETSEGQLSILQQAFIDAGAVQCGFCTPGMIMSARALLARSLDPTDEEIIEAIAGNLCRCTGYEAIIAAVRDAARNMRATSEPEDQSKLREAAVVSASHEKPQRLTREAAAVAARPDPSQRLTREAPALLADGEQTEIEKADGEARE